MFELFDNVYLLARGQCVYQGSPKTFVPFLHSQNFECPKYNNPADYSEFQISIVRRIDSISDSVYFFYSY